MSNDTTPISELDTRRRRAIYRANYRGTKEMDWLLGKFAEAMVPAMDATALNRFEQLLVLPDPEVNAWILDPSRISGLEFHELITRIRAFHALEGSLASPMTGIER